VARQLLNLLTVVSIVVCWCAFVATWLAAENYKASFPMTILATGGGCPNWFQACAH
jgi:hypothetical protein